MDGIQNTLLGSIALNLTSQLGDPYGNIVFNGNGTGTLNRVGRYLFITNFLAFAEGTSSPFTIIFESVGGGGTMIGNPPGAQVMNTSFGPPASSPYVGGTFFFLIDFRGTSQDFEIVVTAPPGFPEFGIASSSVVGVYIDVSG